MSSRIATDLFRLHSLLEMARVVRSVVFCFLICSADLSAQEVRYIDLVGVTQRTQLRNPPAPQPNCDEGKPCAGGGWGGVSIGDGAADRRDPHALGIYLVSVSPTEIRAGEPFEAEFRVVNTGLAPIDVPVSMHLSDLQPASEYVNFTYYSIALAVHAEDDSHKYVPYNGHIELYGSSDHEDSIVSLKPGEWIRVRSNVKLRSWPPTAINVRLAAGFWMHRNTFEPHAGGQYTRSEGLYPNTTRSPAVAVHLLPPPASSDAER